MPMHRPSRSTRAPNDCSRCTAPLSVATPIDPCEDLVCCFNVMWPPDTSWAVGGCRVARIPHAGLPISTCYLRTLTQRTVVAAEDAVICHQCDLPRRANPAHVRLETQTYQPAPSTSRDGENLAAR